MSDRPVLNVEPRTVLGKKVKNLRLAGLLPANVYGRAVDSTPIQTDAKNFGAFIHTDAIRGAFDLQIEGEKEPRLVVLRALERLGGTGVPIHVDFLQVDMERSVWVTVPLNFTGDPPAVRDLAGTLVISQSTVKVRSLPGDIPKAIDVDLNALDTFTATISVGALTVAAGVELLADPTVVLATVVPPRVVEEVLIGEGGEGEEGAEEDGEDGDETSDQEDSED